LIGTDKAAEAMATRALLGKNWNQYRSAAPMSALGEFTGPKVNRRFAELIMRDDGSVGKRVQSRLLSLLGGRKDAAATEGLKDIAKNHKDEKIRALAKKLLDK